MKLAVHCANLSYPGGPEALAASLAGVARAADQGGVTTLTMMDHCFQMEDLGGPAEPMLEGYTLAGLPGRATPSVSSSACWSPASPTGTPGCWRRRSTTLDVLSGGRAKLGLGAAWYEREHRGPRRAVPARRRAVRAARGDAADLPADVERRRRPVRGTSTTGSPRRSAHPAGAGGRTADADRRQSVSARPCAWSRSTPTPATSSPRPEEVAHKLDVLRRPLRGRRAATRRGTAHRDAPARTRSTTSTFLSPDGGPTPRLGIDQVWIGPRPDDPVGWTERACAEVLPRLSELG